MGRWRMRGAESSEAGAVLGDLLPTIAEAATRLSAATVGYDTRATGATAPVQCV